MVKSDTDNLVVSAAGGDRQALDRLLARFRGRLRRMVAVRMDPRLSARIDPSDVVQETLREASGKLPAYARERPLPFYAWLRQLAFNRLLDLHRRHVTAQRRSVKREDPELSLADRSARALAERVLAVESSPSQRMMQSELRRQVREALARLPSADYELLVLRHLEQLSIRDISAVLGISEGAVKTRHVRALKRLRDLLDHLSEEFEA